MQRTADDSPHSLALRATARPIWKEQMTMEMPENSTVLSLLEHLNLDANLVKVAVNGQIVAKTMILVEESEIALLPPVSGG